MRLVTSDYSKTLDVGTGTIWYSLYSTVMVRVPETVKQKTDAAIVFLKSGECASSNALAAAKQMMLIRDALKVTAPEEAVLDLKDLSKPAPWKRHISKAVCSCADLYTSAEGGNLLDEVIDLLMKAGLNCTDVIVG